MSERLAEYLVVVGPGDPTTVPDTSNATSPDFVLNVEVSPYIVQKFPNEDRPHCPLPFGIERFCRSHSWSLTSHPSPPSFNNFILTSEIGNHLYCSSLNFYQPSNKMLNRRNQCKSQTDQPTTSLRRGTMGKGGAVSPFSERRRTAFKKKDDTQQTTSTTSLDSITMSSIDLIIDEENESNLDTIGIAADLYEPFSLCLVSKFSLYDALQALLKSIFVYHLLDGQDLSTASNGSPAVLSFESLIAELLVDLRFPLGDKPPLKRGFGPLKEITLNPLKVMKTIPYTSDNTFKLLKAVGVHGLLQILSLILADGKIVFISSSTTTITSAMISIMALMYPMEIEHFSFVLIPSGFLEYLHCITPFIMGLHRSILVELDEEPLDVTMIDLDSGEVKLGETTELPSIPLDLLTPVKTALTKIIDLNSEHRDSVFVPPVRPRSVYHQDKTVRAIFMNMFLYILGTYQRYVTVVRFHPEPKFIFNKEDYISQYCVGEESDSWRTFLSSISDTIGFISFTTTKRVLPHRTCDFFDELVKEYCGNNPTLTDLFSPTAIHELADKLHKMMPPAIQYGGVYLPTPDSSVINEATSRRFPKFKEEELQVDYDDLESRWKGAANTAVSFSNVPLAEVTDKSEYHTITKGTRELNREIECLNKFLDALFNSRILEARKYFTTVTVSLRQRTITSIFVPELVNRLLKYGPYLSSEQFEVLVRIVNSALTDENIAMLLLPLTSVFYQEIQPGVNQYLFTCIQSHSLWSNTKFWCKALYNAIQSELVRVYADMKYAKRANSFNKPTDAMEDDSDEDEQFEIDNSDISMIGEITLRHRQRIRSVSPSRVRTTARSVVLSKNARMRIRACTTIPGASEGVLPPDSRPVNSYEALHHLAKRLRVWPLLSEVERQQLSLQEENAIRNQIILFISRLINIRTPIEFTNGKEEMKEFATKLTKFIDNFLTLVDTDLDLSYKKQSSILEQVEPLIEVHLNSMESLRNVLKKSPTAKTRVAPLPLLKGEKIIMEGTRSLLLRDGRDTRYWVPADGHVYLTSYRIVFLGSPWDPEVDPNILVTRSMPISSVYRMKELHHIPSGISDGFVTIHGLQLRSMTGELIKLGFDEDSNVADVKRLMSKLIDLRYPLTITVGVRDQSQFHVKGAVTSVNWDHLSETKSKGKRALSSNDLDSVSTKLPSAPSQLKLLSDLSRSPYCKDFDRVGLGSVNFMSRNRGPLRHTTINTSFTVCPSYPSVFVVPDKLSDDSIARIAPHFIHNRIPAVTWRHHRTKAILLRSAAFITPAAPRKKAGLLHGRGSDKCSSEADTVGILSADIECFINILVGSCPKFSGSGEDTTYWSGSFSQDVSIPLTSLRFDLDADQPVQGGLASQITSVNSGQQIRRYSDQYNVEESESHYRHSLYASTDESRLLDWESPSNYVREISFEEQPNTLSSRELENQQPLSLMPLTSIPPTSLYHKSSLDEIPTDVIRTPVDYVDTGIEETVLDGSPLLDWSPKDSGGVIGRGLTKKSKRKNAHVNFASIPTNPRDWIVMDALKDEIHNWKTLGLYIIGEKSVLMNVQSDVYPDCTIIPVEISHYTDVSTSFKKLMKACCPSTTSSGLVHQKYLSLVEESEWINQLSSILQLSGAIADLMEAQGSSVLVCLENGWDITAQVVSLAQILMDPYYCTIEGFKALIEKEWLAFGHPFSERGCHLKDISLESFSPIFLQFLDCVHQICRQFPLTFEFNDFFLRTIAYHSSSMRFHTFSLDSEKERCSLNWLPYRPRPANTYGGVSNTETFASFWEYIDQLHENSMMFYNFCYQPRREDEEMLRPHSYQANLDIWMFYRDDMISKFPPYDVEFILDGQLTYSDIHHNIFVWDSSLSQYGVPIDPPPDLCNELTYYMKKYTGLMNRLGMKEKIGIVSWKKLWLQFLNEYDHEIQSNVVLNSIVPATIETVDPEMTINRAVRLQSLTLHKTTSLAVLVKGKISMELEEKYNEPHSFSTCKIENSSQYECCYCHHIIRNSEAFRCKNCQGICHTHCKRHMPSNCGSLNYTTGVTTPITEEIKKPRSRTSTASSKEKGSKNRRGGTLHELEGFLYKKGGVVKNWKERYFVLDLDKRHLAYYESDKRGAKLCGKISLDVILSVEECDPINVPPNILKPGQVGYFFKLTTHRRVFMLMTFRASTREVWLKKILESCKKK